MSETSTAIARMEPNGAGAAVARTDEYTFDQIMTLGDVFARSGFFPDARTAAQCVVKMIAGRELGLPPLASMNGFHIIQGKPVPNAITQGALIKRSGRYNYRVIEHDDDHCTLAFYERNGEGWVELGRSTFTLDDARRAGLTTGANKHNWASYPRNMLFSRAMSNGVRWYCSDVTNGPVYTPEELDVPVDPEGNVIDARSFRVVEGDESRPQTREANGGAAPPGPAAGAKAVGLTAKELQARYIDLAKRSGFTTKAELTAWLESNDVNPKLESRDEWERAIGLLEERVRLREEKREESETVPPAATSGPSPTDTSSSASVDEETGEILDAEFDPFEAGDPGTDERQRLLANIEELMTAIEEKESGFRKTHDKYRKASCPKIPKSDSLCTTAQLGEWRDQLAAYLKDI